MKNTLWLSMSACTVLAFTGCSGAASNPPASGGPFPATRMAAPNALGEVLSAKHVTVKNQLCEQGSALATFTANGTARGPYAGPFTSNGTWNYTKIPGNDIWTFSQKYVIKTHSGEVDGTITGNGSKIKAACKTFGPAAASAAMRFSLGAKSGSATTTVIRAGTSLTEHLN